MLSTFFWISLQRLSMQLFLLIVVLYMTLLKISDLARSLFQKNEHLILGIGNL